jgi:DNA repair protein RadC
MENKIDFLELKKTRSEFSRMKITSSLDSEAFIKQFYGDDMEIFESVFILLLNSQNETIGYAKISQGGVAGTVVDTKIICKYALDSFANAVILAHNHPSGSLKPSQADKHITEKIKQALKTFDVILLDHIILTTEGYFSFGDDGII